MKLVTDTELLSRFYGKESELDEGEKFLRNYILHEGWKAGGNMPKDMVRILKQDGTEKPLVKGDNDEKVDDEDDKRSEEVEVFEKKYNFRFEEPNAATITSHAREANAEETLRRKENTRKDARERAKERKEDMKKKQKEEISKLKELKREEIIEKLKKTDTISKGNIFEDRQLLERIQKELETDFIPDLYDKSMTRVFGEKYYDDAKGSEDDEAIEKERGIDLKLMKDGDVGGDDSEADAEATAK